MSPLCTHTFTNLILTKRFPSITASLSTLFLEIYNLSEWQAGLIYLPFALGETASTFFSGQLLDGAYRKARTKRGLSTDRINGDDLDNFPIEKARLNVMRIPMLAIVVCTVAYGWVLQYKLVGCPGSFLATTTPPHN